MRHGGFAVAVGHQGPDMGQRLARAALLQFAAVVDNTAQNIGRDNAGTGSIVHATLLSRARVVQKKNSLSIASMPEPGVRINRFCAPGLYTPG